MCSEYSLPSRLMACLQWVTMMWSKGWGRNHGTGQTMLQGTSRAIKIPFLFPNFFFFFFFFLGEDAPSQYVASTQTQAFAMDSQMGMPRLAEDSQAFNFTNESQDPFARKPHGEVMKLGGFS